MKKSILTALLLLVSVCAYAEIRIGALLALSGPISNLGKPGQEIIDGVVEEANKKNLLGDKIRVISYDTQSLPDRAQTYAKKLIAKDKVDVIVGPNGTGEALSVIGEAMSSKTPIMAFAGGTSVVEPLKPYIFKSPQKTSTAIEKAFNYLKKKGLTKIAVAADATGFGQDGLDQINKYSTGLTITAIEKFNATDNDMSTQMAKLLSTKPQAVVIWTVGRAGAIAAKNLRALDKNILMVQSHGIADNSYLKLAGDAAENTVMPSVKLTVASSLPANDPQKKVIDAFVAKYGKLIDETSVHASYAYDGINLVLSALKKAKAEKITLQQALEKTTKFVGVTGVYNMSKNDHCGLDLSSMVMVRVKNGQFVLEEM